MLFQFKRKEKFDKHSLRGMIYVGIAVLGISYELIFSTEIRVMLIIGYSIFIVFGILYICYIKSHKQN